jgi:hypothetical protein
MERTQRNERRSLRPLFSRFFCIDPSLTPGDRTLTFGVPRDAVRPRLPASFRVLSPPPPLVIMPLSPRAR